MADISSDGVQKAAAAAQPSGSTATHPSRTKLALHRKLVFSYAIIGIVIGYISFLINVPLHSLLLAIVVGIITTVLFKKLFKPVAVGGKHWWSSGVTVYVFTWLVVWTILFNMYVVMP